MRCPYLPRLYLMVASLNECLRGGPAGGWRRWIAYRGPWVSFELGTNKIKTRNLRTQVANASNFYSSVL